MNKIFSLLFCLLTVILPAAATKTSLNIRADSIRNQLQYLNTPADSIKLLYDIFDIETSDADRRKNGEILYKVATRANDNETRLDMLRQLAAVSGTDPKAILILRAEANKMRPSTELNDTKLFLDLFYILNKSRTSTEAERQRDITSMIASVDQDMGDWYAQVKNLYTVCAYLSQEGTVNLLADYLDKLDNKLAERRDLNYAVRNLYYTAAAIHYTSGQRPYKAVEADKTLLNIISELEKQYKGKGRKFRNYNVQKYVSYRRMLQNYSALTEKEINEIYAEILRLTKVSPTVKADFEAYPRAKAAYLTATKRYAEAIPVLKTVLAKSSENNKDQAFRLSTLRMLMEAAKAIGDEKTLASAQKEYNGILAQKKTMDTNNLYRELQIKYDVNQLQAKNAELILQKRNDEIASTRQVIWIISAALFGVIVLVIILLYYYLHARHLSRNLTEVVNRLEQERDMLNKMQNQLISARDRAEAANHAKDEFLHSISHEIRTPLNAIMGFSRLIAKKVPESLVPKFKNFSHQIVYNTELLEVLINDILYLSSIDKHSPALSTERTSASTLLSLAAQWTAHKVRPGVFIDCPMPRPDIILNSDRSSIEEVLMKLLSNAAKFTAKGSIKLECVDNGDNTASFIITDTGCGIPKGSEHKIFDRFVKLDNFTQGTGLGLYICARLAESVGGTISVDTSYTDGARFVFTVPKNI